PFHRNVIVMGPLASRNLVSDARLIDAALNGEGDQLFVPLGARSAAIDLRKKPALVVIGIGIHARKCADPATSGPSAGALAVRDRDALAAFNQRQHFPS